MSSTENYFNSNENEEKNAESVSDTTTTATSNFDPDTKILKYGMKCNRNLVNFSTVFAIMMVIGVLLYCMKNDLCENTRMNRIERVGQSFQSKFEWPVNNVPRKHNPANAKERSRKIKTEKTKISAIKAPLQSETSTRKPYENFKRKLEHFHKPEKWSESSADDDNTETETEFEKFEDRSQTSRKWNPLKDGFSNVPPFKKGYHPLKKRVLFTTQGRKGPEGVIQTFVSPKTAFYRITLYGAAGGGSGTDGRHRLGGRGARVSGLVFFKEGEEVSIVVGQRGGDWTPPFNQLIARDLGPGPEPASTGGGGGTFVYSGKHLYAAAGGGGGVGYFGKSCPTPPFMGEPGRAGENGGDVMEHIGELRRIKFGGRHGLGGNASIAGGGAGWFASGEDGFQGRGQNGKSKEHNWQGGVGGIKYKYYGVGGAGGFGGGGSSECCVGGGGGGGYSGGAGGYFCSGGGGGSFCEKYALDCRKKTGGNFEKDGRVVITYYEA